MEIFFSKILDRVTEPVSDKYNNTFINSTSEPYDWGKRTSVQINGGKTGYETNECFTWLDDNMNWTENCYVDDGALSELEDGLPWDMKRAKNDVSIEDANSFIAGFLEGLRGRDDMEYLK